MSGHGPRVPANTHPPGPPDIDLGSGKLDTPVDETVLGVRPVLGVRRNEERGASESGDEGVQFVHQLGKCDVALEELADCPEAVDHEDGRAILTERAGDRLDELLSVAARECSVNALQLERLRDRRFVEKGEAAKVVQHLAVRLGE